MEYSKDIIFNVGNKRKDKFNWTSIIKNHKIIFSVVSACLILIIFDIALIYSFAQIIKTI